MYRWERGASSKSRYPYATCMCGERRKEWKRWARYKQLYILIYRVYMVYAEAVRRQDEAVLNGFSIFVPTEYLYVNRTLTSTSSQTINRNLILEMVPPVAMVVSLLFNNYDEPLAGNMNIRSNGRVGITNCRHAEGYHRSFPHSPCSTYIYIVFHLSL